MSEQKSNGLSSALNSTLAAGVVVLHSAKSEPAWWAGFWVIGGVSLIHFSRAVISLARWIKLHFR